MARAPVHPWFPNPERLTFAKLTRGVADRFPRVTASGEKCTPANDDRRFPKCNRVFEAPAPRPPRPSRHPRRRGSIPPESQPRFNPVLTAKFGTVPGAVVTRVRTASIENRDRWFDRALVADALDVVLIR